MTPHDHVVLGALLHDVGKFWERAERLDEYRRNELQKQLDCPLHRDGYRSHLHVLNTRRFGETLADQAPFLEPRTGDSPDHWLNLAATTLLRPRWNRSSQPRITLPAPNGNRAITTSSTFTSAVGWNRCWNG